MATSIRRFKSFAKDVTEPTEYIHLTKQEAVNLIGLLSAQLVDSLGACARVAVRNGQDLTEFYFVIGSIESRSVGSRRIVVLDELKASEVICFLVKRLVGSSSNDESPIFGHGSDISLQLSNE